MLVGVWLAARLTRLNAPRHLTEFETGDDRGGVVSIPPGARVSDSERRVA